MKSEQLAALLRTQREIATAAPGLVTVLQTIVERARELLEADGASLALLEGAEAHFRAASGTASRYVPVRVGLDGLVGAAVRAGELMRCDDAETDTRIDRAQARQTEVGSVIVVPLIHDARALGVLAVSGRRPHAFDDEQVEMLRLLAGMFSGAVHQAIEFDARRDLLVERTLALESERKRAERSQAALYRIAEAANREGSLKEMLRTVHETLAELMPAPHLSVAIYDAATQKFDFPYCQDEHGPHAPCAEEQGKGLTDDVQRTGRPLLVPDPATFAALSASGEVKHGQLSALSWVGVPLVKSQRTIGVLAAQIYSGAARFTQPDLALLQFVSTQVAHAIERKQSVERLRASEERFRALLENTADGVAVVSADGAVLYRSPAALQMLGYSEDELTSDISAYAHPEDLELLRRTLAEVMAKPRVPVAAQIRARHKSGSWRSIDNVFTNLLDDPAVRGIVVNFRDATEHKQITARLMMADRMVSVGTLAAGVAHEINNPLAYVIANLGFLETALGAPEQRGEVEAALREAQEGAERVRLIVRDLKTFSRDDGASPVPIDVHRVLDASANLAGHEIRQRAQLVKDYAPSLPPVLGSESRLGQVFVNLLVNAAQAIPEGKADSNEVRITTRAGLGEVVVEISDSGKGIPAGIRARLFDPFFTTKPLGVGTGLGLFVCQNLVTAAGGQIGVESAPGRGSTFRVTLPTVDAAFSRPQRVGPSAAPAPVSTARILVVDDEPMIASAMRRALAGYTLVTETSARAALGRIERGERFELIFCDLMMPDMGGIEFHEALAARFPEEAQRIVFLTGGAFTPATQSFLARVGNRRLDKPFELHSLRALIEDHLAAGLKRA